MVEELVIAIDPGRDKCGVAVVHRTRGVLGREVTKTSEAVQRAAQLLDSYDLSIIVLGNSTSSRHLKRQLEGIQTAPGKQIEIALVNEYRSTDEARIRYWSENPPRGIKRLIPLSMQVPPVPVDDYAAVILAERYFEGDPNLRN